MCINEWYNKINKYMIEQEKNRYKAMLGIIIFLEIVAVIMVSIISYVAESYYIGPLIILMCCVFIYRNVIDFKKIKINK